MTFERIKRIDPVRRMLAAAGLLWVSFAGLAHPISLSTAVIDVREDKIVVDMRILVEDLMLYQQLKADSSQYLSAADLRSAAENHHDFLLKYFQIRTLEGERLSGKVQSTDSKEIPEKGVRLDEVMSFAVYYQIEYPLAKKPSFLTFSQNFGGSGASLPAMMDLILLQNGARLGFPVQIGPRTPYSTEIDWKHPPTNDRKSWRERRKLMRERRKKLLGITNYSGTYSYIYITNYQIRHEILVPLLTLETWLPVDRADPDFLEVSEQEALVPKVEALMRKTAPATLDGIQVEPVLERLDFYSLDFKDFAQRSPKRRVSVINGRAGIILVYSTKGTPQEVQLHWNLFNLNTPLLNSLVYLFDDAASRFFFTPDEATYTWSNPGRRHEVHFSEIPSPEPIPTRSLPLATLACGLLGFVFLIPAVGRRRGLPAAVAIILFGSALALRGVATVEIKDPLARTTELSDEQKRVIFGALHRNIYRAFDYRDEEQIYDALSRSVSGELLEDLYLKIRQGLRVQKQGGAVARIRKVEIVEAKPIAPGQSPRFEHQRAFAFRCKWNVEGTVEHWGHIHARKNQYDAAFDVTAVSGAWKISHMEVLQEKALEFWTTLRGLK